MCQVQFAAAAVVVVVALSLGLVIGLGPQPRCFVESRWFGLHDLPAGILEDGGCPLDSGDDAWMGAATAGVGGDSNSTCRQTENRG